MKRRTLTMMILSPKDWRGSLHVYKSPLLPIRIENVIDSGFTIGWDANDLYSNYRVGVDVEDIDEVLHIFPTSGFEHKIVRGDIVDSYSYYCRLIASFDSIDDDIVVL